MRPAALTPSEPCRCGWIHLQVLHSPLRAQCRESRVEGVRAVASFVASSLAGLLCGGGEAHGTHTPLALAYGFFTTGDQLFVEYLSTRPCNLQY
jgi:hypothetical protein